MVRAKRPPVKRRAKSRPESALPETKSREVLGVVLAVTALILLAALTSHSPDDPSLFQHSTDSAQSRNWIGPVGANLSALTFEIVGLVGFLLPLFLGISAWRRLRPRLAVKVVGRGLGTVIVLLCLPALLQLVLGDVDWRGSALRSGGLIGVFGAEKLQPRMGFIGTLFLLLGAVVVGSTLIVQSSLGEMLAAWRRRVRAALDERALKRSRLRERRDKDEARQRVVEKHLKRAGGGSGTKKAEPVRIVEKRGQGSFSVRKVAAPATVGLSEKPRREKSKIDKPKSQKALFADQPGGSSALPPINLLSLEEEPQPLDETQLVRLGDVITRRCQEFGVEGTIEGISPGPVVTVFELQPAPGVKVRQIVNLQNDLALSLKAESIRIDRLPGRSTLGIEVPNVKRQLIHLGPLFKEEEFQRSPSVLTMAIGRDLHGQPYYADLATMPHLLVAGATGAGKSVGLQSMITSILYKARRDEVQFILIDPKRIELGVYAEIPHLKTEVVVEPKKAANALRWAVAEMERRYRLLAEVHVRSISYYNRAIKDPKVQQRLALAEGDANAFDDDLAPLPYYVIVIDELADLMMVASSEVETAIARLAQMARAVGIHLILATQRPSVDVLTGTIKANFPCRIAYATASHHDSRTILGHVGAEQLLGGGDMLFMPPGTARITRLHGPYISEQETAAVVRWLRKQGKPDLDPEVLKAPPDERSGGDGSEMEDELFDEAARLVVAEGQASASFLQRRMRIGFSRAARLIDMMEQDGLLGPPQGSKPRAVLVKADYFSEME